jgi:CubicO group peptidase (beta-lactamase class C family)
MRRLLVAGLIVFLTVVPGVIGVVAADWPFWSRVARIPSDSGTWPDSFYEPRFTIEGAPQAFFPQAAADRVSLDPVALEQASQWAAANNSVALLVLHRGVVQLERYYGGATAETLVSGRDMTRSMLGFVVGIALAEGKITSLDTAASTWLPEWRNDPRGAITLRQLLQNTSGLEELPSTIPARGEGVLGWWPPFKALVTNQNARLSLGSDFAGAALAFKAAHPPGVRFYVSNANAQLVAVILERATGEPFETYVNSRLWAKLGAGRAELYLDRRNGMPAAYCCLRATARDFLRLGALLVDDGQIGGQRVLPPGWVPQMAAGSVANASYGLQIWTGRTSIQTSESSVAGDVIWMASDDGPTMWAIPSQQLVVLRLGPASAGSDAAFLPDLLLRAVRD